MHSREWPPIVSTSYRDDLQILGFHARRSVGRAIVLPPETLEIPTQLLLALPEAQFQAESVNRGGVDWVMRYQQLCQRVTPRVLAESKQLPRWLSGKKDYDIWQRNNLWMMYNALATQARSLTLIALYNREKDPDGPGGTAHLVKEAAAWGFKTVELDARQLLIASGS